MKQSSMNNSWVSYFRILISLFAMVSLLLIWNDIPKFLYEGAYINPELLDTLSSNFWPSLVGIHQVVNNFFNVEYNVVVEVVIYSYIVSLIFLCVGLFTRTSAILALLLQLVLLKSMHIYAYGADYFLSLALFYCVIFPKGKISLDSYLFNIKQNPISLKWSLILLKSHLGVIYFLSGLDKGLGINWYNGESIWRAISGHTYNSVIDMTNVEVPIIVFQVIGILTLIVEFFYPLFTNLPKTRSLWLSLTLLMHVCIALFMGLYMFSILMIIINLAAYYFPYLSETRTAKKYNEFERIQEIFASHFEKKQII